MKTFSPTPGLIALLSIVLLTHGCTTIHMAKNPAGPPGDEPLLLVHGFADVHWAPWWDRLVYYLTQSGYRKDRIHRMNLGDIPGTTIGDPRHYGTLICRRLQDLSETYSEEFDIIAHSMGGISSRWCIQELEGAVMVDDLITLGTPHQGVKGLKESTGWLRNYFQYIPRGAEALEEGSPLLKTLNSPPLPAGVEFTAVWSRTDYIFLLAEWSGSVNGFFPETLTRQSNVRNIRVPFVEGHADLISSKRVFRLYQRHLN